MRKLEELLPSAAVTFSIEGRRTLPPESFSPMSDNIIVFSIRYFDAFSTDLLQPLKLQSLASLFFYRCDQIIITKRGMLSLAPTLGMFTALVSTIQLIERGAFESLQVLQSLRLEYWTDWSDLRRAETVASSQIPLQQELQVASRFPGRKTRSNGSEEWFSGLLFSGGRKYSLWT